MAIPFDPRWETEELTTMGFDQYQRYRLTAELLLAIKQAYAARDERWQVLDVGGFHINSRGEQWLPMAAFAADDEVRVVDMVPCDLPGYRQASGADLPFADGAFDVVVSCDTLEHVPQEQRGAFIEELRRVARRAVVLAAPHATPGVATAERALAEYLRSFGLHHGMLEEHLLYGIPEPSWTDTWLNERNIPFAAFPSGYLPRWLTMMMLRHQLVPISATVELDLRLEQTYNQLFYERDQRGPGYRRVYVIPTSGSVPATVEAFVERAARPEPEDPAATMVGLAVAPLIRALTHLIQLQTAHAAQAGRTEEQRLLGEAHVALLGRYEEALRTAAVLEGEKRGLQQQLEMLRWQNDVLQARLSAVSPLAGLRRRVGDLVRLARRPRSRR